MLTINKNQPNFKIITKQKAYSRESEDVVITILNGEQRENRRHRKQRVLFHFHNMSKDRITTTGYIALGIDGDRLYFIEADSKEGYKISCSKNDRNGTCQVTDDSLVEWVNPRRGAYGLHQDSKSGMYYIQAISEEKK